MKEQKAAVVGSCIVRFFTVSLFVLHSTYTLQRFLCIFKPAELSLLLLRFFADRVIIKYFKLTITQTEQKQKRTSL